MRRLSLISEYSYGMSNYRNKLMNNVMHCHNAIVASISEFISAKAVLTPGLHQPYD